MKRNKITVISRFGLNFFTSHQLLTDPVVKDRLPKWVTYYSGKIVSKEPRKSLRFLLKENSRLVVSSENGIVLKMYKKMGRRRSY